jgi:GNAT superfamily N-acetyltransferase
MFRVAVPLARIRPRQLADLPALVEGLALVAAADGYPSRWPQDPAGWLRSRDLLGAWVAERAGDVLGQVVLRRAHGDVPVDLWCAATGLGVDRCAVVTRMFVTPVGQGAGLGQALLTAAWNAALELGLQPLVDVVSTNRSAVGLYERLGWTRLGSYEQTFRDGGPAELLHCFAAPA